MVKTFESGSPPSSPFYEIQKQEMRDLGDNENRFIVGTKLTSMPPNENALSTSSSLLSASAAFGASSSEERLGGRDAMVLITMLYVVFFRLIVRDENNWWVVLLMGSNLCALYGYRYDFHDNDLFEFRDSLQLLFVALSRPCENERETTSVLSNLHYTLGRSRLQAMQCQRR